MQGREGAQAEPRERDISSPLLLKGSTPSDTSPRVCRPGTKRSCYGGPAGTLGVGTCRSGQQLCNALGTGYSACFGRVLPAVEDCSEPADEDCNGLACSEPLWGSVFGDESDQRVTAVAVGPEGDVYVAGWFEGTVDLGGIPLVSAGGADAFIARLDAWGGHGWSYRYGDAGTQVARSIAVDAAGDVVVTGSFEGTIGFGGGVLTSAGEDDAFLVKLSGDGAHVWSTRLGGSGYQAGRSVAVGPSGEIAVAGDFTGQLEPCAHAPCASTSRGGTDIFVAGYDSAGARLWTRMFGDVEDQGARGVAVDSDGGVVVTGAMEGTVDFGGGPLAAAGQDVFVLRLDEQGNHTSSQRFGNADRQAANAVAIDSAGDLWLTGQMNGTLSFGGAALSAAGPAPDLFVAKLSAGGAHLFSRRFGDGGAQVGTSITTDAQDHVVFCGYGGGEVDFGGGEIASDPSVERGFVVKLDAAGQHLWSRPIGGGDLSIPTGVATTPAGYVAVGGLSLGQADLGAGPLPTEGGMDAFAAELAP